MISKMISRSALVRDLCKIGICGGIVLGLISCAIRRGPLMDIGDGGFLTGKPCAPPCLWGIIPGKTTEAEVIGILHEKGIYNFCDLWDRRSSGGLRGITCKGLFVVDFGVRGDIVQGVGFTPSSPVTLQDVIAKYGEPDWIAIFIFGVHVFTYEARIAYPHICTIILFSSETKPYYTLKPSTRIQSISYSVDSCEPSRYVAPDWQKWRGYGEYWPYNFPTPTPGAR